MNQELFLIIFFVAVLFASVGIHKYFLSRATRQSIKKYNITGERWASQRKPMLGGVGFFAGFVISVIVWHFCKNTLSAETNVDLPIGVIVAIILAFVMGLIDDIFNTSPMFKFLMQFAVGIILISAGIYIRVFDNLWLNYALTLFWVVGIMNSLNMLDNMDSVTNTMCSLLLIGVIVMLLAQASISFFTIVAIGTLASMMAFFKFNWHPSKMYMGDNGSQFLGAFMAIMSIQFLWNPASEALSNNVYPFLIVYLAFLVPLTDTATVTINRMMRGQSPFVGGTDHTTHHLSYRGLSDRQVVMVLGAINALSVATAVCFLMNPPKSALPLWIAGGVAIVVSSLLYANTKLTKPNNK